MTTSRNTLGPRNYPHTPAAGPNSPSEQMASPADPLATRTRAVRVKATLSNALVALQRDAETLPRDAANERYLYTTADAISGRARELLSQHGLSWSRVSTTVRRPALASGELEGGEYVGDVVIRWTLRHEGGETVDGAGEYPIVVTPQRPHDKAVAAAITYGCGQILMGLLCWDRESQQAVDRRTDGPPVPHEPLCRGRAAAIAKACRERAADLAALRESTEGAVWSEVLAELQVGARGRREPRADQLTVQQGKAVNDRLKLSLAAERSKRRGTRGEVRGAA